MSKKLTIHNWTNTKHYHKNMACCCITDRLTGPKSRWCSGCMWCHAVDEVPDPGKQKYYCSNLCPKLQKLHSFVALLKLYIYTANFYYNKLLWIAKTIFLYWTYSQRDRFKKSAEKAHFTHLKIRCDKRKSLGETKSINLQLKRWFIHVFMSVPRRKQNSFFIF